MNKTLLEIAKHLDGRLVGEGDLVISGLSGLLDARPGELSFVSSDRYRRYVSESAASALLVYSNYGDCPVPRVEVERPEAAFDRLVEWFLPEPAPVEATRHPSAAIATSAQVADDATLMAHVTVGSRARVGAGTVLHPGVVLSDSAVVGRDCVIHPNVTIGARVVLGDRVCIHAGSVIGADGFGFRPSPTGHQKIEHIGTVEIGDDVEIGANCSVDRARFGRTRIGAGTKIDNQVHIAHNVQVGRHCIIIAQTGISGSVVIGDGTMIGGQCGTVGHIRIGSGVRCAARSGISKDVPDGAVMYGFIAGDHHVRKREEAAIRKLPKLIRRVRELEVELSALKKERGEDGLGGGHA